MSKKRRNNKSSRNFFNKEILKTLSSDIRSTIASEIEKQIQPQLKAKKSEDTFQMDFPFGMNQHINTKVKRKPEGSIAYQTLRNFSVHYPVARACIDYIKTKIEKLDWEIVPRNKEEDIDKDDARYILAKDFFMAPEGRRSSYREFIAQVVEDYHVIGAISVERLRTRGNQFLGELKTVDPTTIKILVDDHGRTPEPPKPAYKQFIRGREVAELSQDDLIYIRKNPRTNSAYGLAPLESLLVQAEGAIQGALYALKWFSDGNMPESFGTMPEGWSNDQIKQFQTYYDSMFAGNPNFQRKLKFMPEGFDFMQVKKPSEISYERFELWMLQQTCAVFGVPPQDIGFTHQINKSSSETQQELGQERSMKPTAMVLEEMFTRILRDDFGFEDLRFSYVNVDPVDQKLEAEIDKMRLESGIISLDEIRSRDGLEPLGVGHFVLNGQNIVMTEQLTPEGLAEKKELEASMFERQNPEEQVEEEKEKEDDPKEKEKEKEEKEKVDILTWMKQSKNAMKKGKPFKKFSSDILEDWAVDEIYKQLQEVKEKDQILKVFEPYLNNNMQTIRSLKKLSDELYTITENLNQ